MKAIAVKSFISIMGATCLLLSSHLSAAEVRLGHVFTGRHPCALSMELFASEIEKLTNGEIKVKIYPNSSLGSAEKMLQATQSGVQELFIGTVTPLSANNKELQIFNFPLLFSDTREVTTILDGPIGQKMLKDMQDVGLVGLAWPDGPGSFRDFANIKRPLLKYEDFKGLKIRVMPSPVWIETFRAMGMNALPMAYTEVHSALETKALDGIEHPVTDMFENKVYEIIKYLTITHHGYAPHAIVASSKWFSSLTPSQQAAVRKAAEIASDFQRKEEEKQMTEVINALRSNGMEVNELPREDVVKMRAAIRPVLDKFAEEVGVEFVKNFYAEVEKVRKSLN